MRTVNFTFENAISQPLPVATGSIVPLLILKPSAQGIGVFNGKIVTRDAIEQFLDNKGSASFADVVPGTYSVSVSGPYALSPFSITVPVMDGTYNAADLITTSSFIC